MEKPKRETKRLDKEAARAEIINRAMAARRNREHEAALEEFCRAITESRDNARTDQNR